MNSVERITKVKFKEGEWIVTSAWPIDDGEKEAVTKCRAQPHPDLPAALQALEPTVREILQLPPFWRQGELTITGATWSLSESTGVEGACIVASVGLDTCNAPLNLVTPFLPFGQYSEGAECTRDASGWNRRFGGAQA